MKKTGAGVSAALSGNLKALSENPTGDKGDAGKMEISGISGEISANAKTLEESKSALGRKIAVGKGLREDEWGSAGSEVLSDTRKERYCQLVAGGCDEVEAYWKAFKDSCGLVRTKRSTAIRENTRIKGYSEVKSRIEWLQGEQRKEAKLGKREKLVITEEVISGLRADFKAGERGKTVTDLMAALQRHDQMTGDGGTPVLEIRLDFGGLLEGVEKLVEGRLSGRIPKPAEGEVIEL